MQVEQREILAYLATLTPFDLLPEPLLERAANSIEISYFRQGSGGDLLDYNNPKLYIVRTGAFELHSEAGELVDRIEPKGFFGYPSLLTGDAITNRLQVIEDGLVYILDQKTFSLLREKSRAFDRFFNRAHARRVSQTVRAATNTSALTRIAGSLIRQPPVSIEPEATVQQAAQQMRDQRVSSILVCRQQQLLGILTDRDLRARVLAQGLPGSTPVSQVMTPNPISLPRHSLVFEALLAMTEANIHHLPLTDQGLPCGVISSTDIIMSQRADPLMLINRISRCHSNEQLAAASSDIPQLLLGLINADARAEEIGKIISTITDAITQQLLRLAEASLGPAPVPYAWIAFGSQARKDQTGYSDQDNGLLLDDSYNAVDHGAYFQALAESVCAGLDACGYRYCNGLIMAQTERWRQPLTVWRGYFDQWISSPTPKALMHASIFFDLRHIAGAATLSAQLQQHVLQHAAANTLFLACMAQNALQHTPPLGLFKQFVLESDGDQQKMLNLKQRGVVPIVDIARLYSLAAGISAVNTHDRLRALAATKQLSLRDCRSLADCLEFIAHLRFENQGRQLASGRRPSNFVNPKSVSDLVRHQLRDAFSLVRNAQDAVRSRFTRGLL